MKFFGQKKSTVAKKIQCEDGPSETKYHGSVQLYRVMQSYIRGIKTFFNITTLLFWSFFLVWSFLEIQTPPNIVIFNSNLNVSDFDQPLIKWFIINI